MIHMLLHFCQGNLITRKSNQTLLYRMHSIKLRLCVGMWLKAFLAELGVRIFTVTIWALVIFPPALFTITKDIAGDHHFVKRRYNECLIVYNLSPNNWFILC
eukprot:TRINITY_DN11557_c0_g1_i8.p1 TRINITY_DN11557_c0_g1~~TRINITY_DN11557_c0_g1_i8.p1  ORF type:complete len:102 (-),score=0.81 TRINITY_DN11557_c0_g1_i8:943-1248(-)